jgi:hypothetical protein
MSLSDIYNPKEGYASTEYSWFKGNSNGLSKDLKADVPAIMRDNYCRHLNPSHRETLLSLHLACELLWMAVNSLTPKSVLAGTKNSCSEGFLLTKHKHTNIPTMMEPFPPPAPWFWWTSVPHPREPLWKGLDEAVIEGFNIKL